MPSPVGPSPHQPPNPSPASAAAPDLPHPADALAGAIDHAGSCACVGLDPVVERLPEAVRAAHWEPVRAIEAFSLGVIDAVRPHVGVLKFQSACYERYGGLGVQCLERCMHAARQAGLYVILDAKRGDIGISAEHYAAAARHAGAHAVTVSGYLGPTGIVPFLQAGLLAFVLVRTSNPDSDTLQSASLADGRSVADAMADVVAELGADRLGSRGLGSAGAVIGATKPADAGRLRARLPDAPVLVPGYGAQGGTLDDVRALARHSRAKAGTPSQARPGDLGVVVTASRSVLYPASPPEGGDWRQPIAAAAERLARELSALGTP